MEESPADNPMLQGSYIFNLFPDNGGEHLALRVDHTYTRRKLTNYLERRYGEIAMMAVYTQTGELYPWYTGSFLQFMPLVGYVRHLNVCFGLYRRFHHERVAIQLDGEMLGLFTVTPTVMAREDFGESVYQQLRAHNPNLPSLHLLRQEPHLDYSPSTIDFCRIWAKRYYTPVIIGGTSLMNILYIPIELLGMRDRCPRCRQGFMERGLCLGGFYTYELPDGSRFTERFECLNAPGEQEGVGDGFSDRARMQTMTGSRYRKRYHFQETITSLHGTQDTAIDPRIIEDIRSYASLRGWTRVTARQVKEALMTLESYYHNVYDKWYQDAQLIATRVNGDDAAVENAIPIFHQRQLVEIYDSAVFAWKSCPASVRGDRRNFLQNNYNIWVACTIAAKVHHEPRFLEYRQLVVQPDGSPPRLRDDRRQHQYENIWRWIIEHNEWGEIEI